MEARPRHDDPKDCTGVTKAATLLGTGVAAAHTTVSTGGRRRRRVQSSQRVFVRSLIVTPTN